MLNIKTTQTINGRFVLTLTPRDLADKRTICVWFFAYPFGKTSSEKRAMLVAYFCLNDTDTQITMLASPAT